MTTKGSKFEIRGTVWCEDCNEQADTCAGCGKYICIICDTTYPDVEGLLCEECGKAELEASE